MSYAIFRSESINTLKDLGEIGAHNKRDKKSYKSNPDIDMSKSKNNIEIVPLNERYSKGYYELVKEYKKEYEEKHTEYATRSCAGSPRCSLWGTYLNTAGL